jgi:hypothetical protein
MARASRQRGGKASKRGLSDKQIPVLIAVIVLGAPPTSFWRRLTRCTSALRSSPYWQAMLYSAPTAARHYAPPLGKMGIAHRPINLAAGIRVVTKVYHVQNVNAYDSRLKEWMRRFHGIATHYLANYLDWRRLIDRTHGPSISRHRHACRIGNESRPTTNSNIAKKY